MFVKINKPVKNATGNNKGSSFNLIDYLNKENKNLSEKELFFNNKSDNINKIDAIKLIDGNNQRLSKDEAKFYTFNISPSEKELEHLEKIVQEKTKQLYDSNNKEHIKEFKSLLKDYTNDVLNVYGASFNRSDKNGDKISFRANDFVYVAICESKRTFNYRDYHVIKNKEINKEIVELKHKITNEPKNALKATYQEQINKLEKSFFKQDEKGKIQVEKGEIIKVGITKLGKNNHVHVVVSRNSKSLWYKGECIIDSNGKYLTEDENKIKNARPIQLSPCAISKGTSDKHKLNDKSVQVGFNNEFFKREASNLFEDKFNYKSNTYEKYGEKDRGNELLYKGKFAAKAKTKSKLKQLVNQHLRGDVLKTEEKLIKTALSPKQAAISKLKQILLEILKGGDLIK